MLQSPELLTYTLWPLYIGVLLSSFAVCLVAALLQQNRSKLTISKDGTKPFALYKTTHRDVSERKHNTSNIVSHLITGKSSEHMVVQNSTHRNNEGQNGVSIRRNKSCNKFQSLLQKLAQDKNPQTMEINQAILKNVPVTYVGRVETPNEVIPGKLFLGSIYAAHNAPVLKKLGITHILSVCDEHLKIDSQQFMHKVIYVDDKSDVDLLARFEEAHNFIDQGVTLVHCLAGISRSATVTISYLMSKMNKTVVEATEVVHAARACIKPNAGFLQQLERYEKALQTQKLT